MDNSTPLGKILEVLKRELKAKHLTYRDMASQLGVSEATIKRHLRGKGVTVEALQNLSEAVGLDFFTVTLLAQDPEPIRHGITKIQLDALNKPGNLRRVFFLLLMGWTPSHIDREMQLGKELDYALDRLEALQLISRTASKSVKVLVMPDVSDPLYGQMQELALKELEHFLEEFDPRDKSSEWFILPVRLPKGAMPDLTRIIAEFKRELTELSKRQLNEAPELVTWYEVFTGVAPVAVKRLTTQG